LSCCYVMLYYLNHAEECAIWRIKIE
jgi:hypothetical protein